MAAIEFEIPPVIKTVIYAGSPEDAFDRFTEGIGTWWPLPTHSLGRDNALSVSFERLEVGGTLVECCRSGERHVWGTIVEIRRPSLISFTWHVGRHEDTAQLIELSFDPSGNGATSVTLTHSGWERLGDRASEARGNYNEGWNQVLGHYVKSGEASTS